MTYSIVVVMRSNKPDSKPFARVVGSFPDRSTALKAVARIRPKFKAYLAHYGDSTVLCRIAVEPVYSSVDEFLRIVTVS